MEWISVNERMPEHNGAVLCCNAQDKDCPVCIGVQVANEQSDFYLFEIGEISTMITHWMELPKLP